MSIDLAAHDCVAQALGRLPAYLNRQRWRELVEVIASEIQELDDAVVAVVAQLHLDRAEGAQLDLIGNRVNEDRGGRADADYRAGIRIRIAVNRSRGLAEDVIRVARLVLASPAPAGTVELQTVGAAAASLAIGGTTAPDPAVVTSILAFAKATVAAGVRLAVTSSSVPDAETFRLAGTTPATTPYLDLAPICGSGFTTRVGYRYFGAADDVGSDLAFIADASAPNAGAFFPGLNAEFLFKPGVTTIADFEAAVAADPSGLLFIVTASTVPGAIVDPDDAFGATPFEGGSAAAGEADGDGFASSAPRLTLAGYLLTPLSGSGFTTIIGARVFDGSNSELTLSFIADAGAPSTGALQTGGYPDLEFLFQDGVTTIADFEAAVAGDASDYLFLARASTVSGVLVAPDDEFFNAGFFGVTGNPGGKFASVQE